MLLGIYVILWEVEERVLKMINEESLDIKYGLLDLRSEREQAKGAVAYIVQDIIDIKSNYIRLGFHLDEFKRFEYYEDFGYSDFYEFCSENLKMDKTAVSRVMSVFYNFSACEDNVRKMWIDESYKDYNFSQLTEMLPLNSKEREKVTPDMTVQQIRDYKKSLKNKSKDNTIVAMSQQEEEKKRIFSDSFDSGLLASYLADFLVDIMDNFSSTKDFKVQNDSKNVFIEIDNEKYRVALFHSKDKGKD